MILPKLKFLYLDWINVEYAFSVSANTPFPSLIILLIATIQSLERSIATGLQPAAHAFQNIVRC